MRIVQSFSVEVEHAQILTICAAILWDESGYVRLAHSKNL